MFSLFRKPKKTPARQKRESLLKMIQDKGFYAFYEPFMDAIYVMDLELILLSDDFGFKSYTPLEHSLIRCGQSDFYLRFKRVHSLEELQAELEANLTAKEQKVVMLEGTILEDAETGQAYTITRDVYAGQFIEASNFRPLNSRTPKPVPGEPIPEWLLAQIQKKRVG